MTDRPILENTNHSISQLSPHEQLELGTQVLERLGRLLPQETSAPASLIEFQRMEAEWITRELEDFVRQIQRYRALYITALFLALGWVLGQAANAPGQITIEAFRLRPDIAPILCVVPLLNVFFVALTLEAHAQIKSLARYRFILGIALGNGELVRRWERWKETNEGSLKYWTNPLNIFSFFIVVMLTTSALVFPFPAIQKSDSFVLWALWSVALLSSVGLVIVIIVVGYRSRNRNAVADPSSLHWANLWPRREDGQENQHKS